MPYRDHITDCKRQTRLIYRLIEQSQARLSRSYQAIHDSDGRLLEVSLRRADRQNAANAPR